MQLKSTSLTGGNSISISFTLSAVAASIARLALCLNSAWMLRFFDKDFSNGEIPFGSGDIPCDELGFGDPNTPREVAR